MHSTLRHEARAAHANLLDDIKPRQAKANVKNVDIEWSRAVGQAVESAIGLTGWSQKEAAAKVGVEPAEPSRWFSGERRAHFDRLMAVKEIRRPLVKALGRLDGAKVEDRMVWPEEA